MRKLELEPLEPPVRGPGSEQPTQPSGQPRHQQHHQQRRKKQKMKPAHAGSDSRHSAAAGEAGAGLGDRGGISSGSRPPRHRSTQ